MLQLRSKLENSEDERATDRPWLSYRHRHQELGANWSGRIAGTSSQRLAVSRVDKGKIEGLWYADEEYIGFRIRLVVRIVCNGTLRETSKACR